MGDEKSGIFAVIGEDARQKAAADYLRRQGWQVLSTRELDRADYVLLPMPMSADRAGFVRLLRAAKPGAMAFGGKVSAQARETARNAGMELADYLEREDLALLNAIPTAEGCLSLLLQHRRRTLWRSPVLVLGYGRCGQALADRLAALGALVSVSARRPAQLALAMSRGLTALPLAKLEQNLGAFDTVINTIPAPILGRQQLALLPAASLIIDLASLPGGTDFEAAQALGHNAIHALSLPARCAPETAGEFVARAVLAMLTERGENP